MKSAKQRIRSTLSPVEPVPTQQNPECEGSLPIKAVLFDIYGTLLISATGDVGTAAEPSGSEPFLAALGAAGLDSSQSENAIRARYFEAIRRSHEKSRTQGIEFPEVEIRSIWTGVLKDLEIPIPGAETVERLALEYELAANRVWPMPGARDLLTRLRDRNILLGIVSNAQFYTPVIFETLFDSPLSLLGFAPELTVWSFDEGRGKPDTELFRRPVETLEARGIRREEILYVGNDMLNDVWTASQWGLKTALFAGDRRSLRLREEKEVVKSVNPDIIVTELQQLETVIQ